MHFIELLDVTDTSTATWMNGIKTIVVQLGIRVSVHVLRTISRATILLVRFQVDLTTRIFRVAFKRFHVAQISIWKTYKRYRL